MAVGHLVVAVERPHTSPGRLRAFAALGETFVGTADNRDFIAAMEREFSSDYRFELGRWVADDDTFAVEWTTTGMHDSADPTHGLPATGRPFQVPGVSIGRLRDGKIGENTDCWNLAGFLTQVGLMPVPETEPATGAPA